jgi:hypothetical protein
MEAAPGRMVQMEKRGMETLLLMLAFTVFLGLVFLVLREVMCWYWKINKGLVLLEEQTQLLRQLRDAATRSEQDAIDRRLAELRRGAGETGAR